MKLALQRESAFAYARPVQQFMIFSLHAVNKHWLAFTLVLLTIITWLSLRTPGAPGGVATPGIDKVQHLIAYAALVAPLMLARPKNWVYCALALFAFSGIIELLQPWFSRTTDLIDMLANGMGLLLGMAVVNGFRGSRLNDSLYD